MQIPNGSDLISLKKMGTPPVSSLVIKEENGFIDKRQCYKFISLCIADILVFFGTSIEPHQNTEACKLIYGEYYYLTVAEWKYFITNAKLLKFGPVYPNISISKLMEWLKNFVDNVMDKTEKSSLSKHLENTQDEKFSNHERQGERDLRREKDEQFAKFKYKPSEPIESEPKPKRSQAEIDAEYEKFINEFKNKNNG